MNIFSEPWLPGFIAGVSALLVAVVGGISQARREKAQRQHASHSPGAPTVQEIWIRQDRMENAFRASLVLLGEVAEQWDGPHPPVLSARSIKILRDSDYLPPELDNLIPKGGE